MRLNVSLEYKNTILRCLSCLHDANIMFTDLYSRFSYKTTSSHWLALETFERSLFTEVNNASALLKGGVIKRFD